MDFIDINDNKIPGFAFTSDGNLMFLSCSDQKVIET